MQEACSQGFPPILLCLPNATLQSMIIVISIFVVAAAAATILLAHLDDVASKLLLNISHWSNEVL